jgi:hypothetical protein
MRSCANSTVAGTSSKGACATSLEGVPGATKAEHLPGKVRQIACPDFLDRVIRLDRVVNLTGKCLVLRHILALEQRRLAKERPEIGWVPLEGG